MSIIQSDLLLGQEGSSKYQVSRSLRFNSADSANLSRNLSSSPSSSFTFSMWVKRSALTPGATYQTLIGGYQSAGAIGIGFGDDDVLRWTDQTTTLVSSTAKFRDPSAWYHIVATRTSSARTIYVNGTQVATGDGGQAWSNGAAWTIGVVSGFYYFNGYLAEIHFIDGQALTPSSFAETDATTGQWIPKLYSGSYGTNGFKLTFSDNSAATATTLGKDTANSNNWTPNNFSVTAGAGNDSLVDTPTSYGTDTGAGGEVRGNYCTFNPLFALASLTLTNGNLETSSPGAAWRNAKGTFAMTTGKWYWEHTVPTTGAADGYIGGVATATADYSSSSTGIWGRQGTTKYSNGSSSTPFGSTTSGDILGFAFDADAGKLWVAQNGTWVGDPGAGTGESWSGIPSGVFPYVAAYNQANVVNFGQRAFAYTNNRSGFKALVDTNLTAPVIAKPNTVFDVIRYTGNGSTQTIPNVNTVPTTLGFSPDFVWIKGRSAATNNALYDLVRGANKRLMSNATDAEISATQDLTAFNSDGFTLGTDGTVNGNSNTYVAWAWDAGSAANPTTNTQGSITSSVRANASAGFSVVTYTVGNNTSQTIGHGLNVAPQLIIVKERNQVNNWQVYHASLGNGSFLYLNATNASASNNLWNNTSPTSTVFSIRSGGSANFYDGKDQVAYCFAPVAGYSSFGSYTGNGSADGPFVYTGFRPRWILMKQSVAGEAWTMYDTARDTYNVAGLTLFANYSNAETDYKSYTPLDILSNGFKLRTSNITWNTNGATVIYAAFAENPFQYARAR